MVRIRLRRQGAKKQPTYRVVVADQRSPRDGRFIENIGFYNPRTDPPTIRIKADRALHWLGVGAQPSDAVLRMLKKTGVWQQFKGIEFEPEAEAEAVADISEAEAEAEVAGEAEAEAEVADEAEAEAPEAPKAGEEAPTEPEADEIVEAEEAEASEEA
jgi:small subunit ribosomal protein S16